jgi:ribulose-phosphate 3-epimerase
MTIIAPSLLSADFLNLQKELDIFKDSPETWLHLDIMDGHFVPNLSFGKPIIKFLKNATPLYLDAHFMVSNPNEYIDQFKECGISNFTFHLEATVHHHRLIQKIKKSYQSVGISINPSTSIAQIDEGLLKDIDLILVMSVNPGFGGQNFIESSLTKIKNLKKLASKYNFKIQVDGGINKKNAIEVIASGADCLVAGSYIFNHPQEQYLSAIESLRKS